MCIRDRIEAHAILAIQRIDRQPPVDLTHRRGIPCVAMRMEGVRNTRAEKVLRVGGSHTRHVEVQLLEVDAVLLHDRSDQPLGLRMMYEFWLEDAENLT